jgi:hypothetical protein
MQVSRELVLDQQVFLKSEKAGDLPLKFSEFNLKDVLSNEHSVPANSIKFLLGDLF